ncbi:hypothetical protein ABB37_06206 [Leptomonas pyrrhocoris]|uniref:Uncharacterized protein n=1 Tax=Leptomonas pyrrhocoris TaxID=157538 RepID=A0A0M9FYQ7_LEPPY|nr:hypothetical protein ABB37_06206 [Leptomonas pyrrhocoris]KPA78606.1 hypothetical protein ABB37_06206 [Leptomonas pyrrhocoris]|eukprot:XP_015657045.1 hypothetical protein ABB37_06206 [Leptomonas pyrrhocoris]
MFVVSAAEGLTAAAAAGGLETSAAVSSSAAAFQRNASTTSVASLHQSFLDAEPADQLRLFTQLRSADGNVKASPAAAAVTSASSSPPPASPSMPQLRTLRGHVGSNTNQAFLDDSDEAAQMQRVGARNGLLNAHVALAGVAKKEENATGGAGVTTSPPPAPPLETRKGCSNPNESNAAVEDDVRYDVFSHASRAAANLSTPLTLTLPQTDFSRQYEHSRNPYLRAAAEEMKASSDDTFQGWGDGDFTGGDDRLGSTSAFVNNAKSRSGHEGVPSSFVLAAHKAPQLTQPFGAPRQRDNTSFREALPATSNVKDDLLSSSGSGAASTLLRGIPLFTRTRQSSRLAASPASSLRQSVEEYGQLQLQNEAVHWYHRSSVLEHQLARLQEMYNRQSKLLAAHWRAEAAAAQPHTTSTRTDTACTDALMKTANADVKEALQRRRPHDASPTPFPVEHRLASAATATASVGSPERRMTELTSRSPDSLPRA